MKPEPTWLAIEVVLAVHEQLVAEHGGSPHLRDRGLLESALASPRHRFSYGEDDVFVLATAYANSITRNHPFIDGNKRTAFVAAYMFLGINGWTLTAPETQVVSMMLGLSDRTISEKEFSVWLRMACVPRKKVKPAAKHRKRSRPLRRQRKTKDG